jgi:hypothetical protein
MQVLLGITISILLTIGCRNMSRGVVGLFVTQNNSAPYTTAQS